MKRLSGLFRSKQPAVDRRAPVTEAILADLEAQAEAAELGFSSDAALGRAFKQRFGISPGQVQSGDVGPASGVGDDNDRLWEQWLRTL